VTGDGHAGILWEPGAEMPRATRPAAYFAKEHR